MADLTTPYIYDLMQEGEELSYPLAIVKCPRGVAIFKDSSGYATPTWANAAANGFLGISKSFIKITHDTTKIP